MALAAGTRLGPREVLSLIGAGDSAKVHRPRDTRPDRTVVIEFQPPTVAIPERRAHVERKARTVSSLTRPLAPRRSSSIHHNRRRTDER